MGGRRSGKEAVMEVNDVISQARDTLTVSACSANPWKHVVP